MSLHIQLIFHPLTHCVPRDATPHLSKHTQTGHEVPGLCRSPGGYLGEEVPAAVYPVSARHRRQLVEVEGPTRDCPDLGGLDAVVVVVHSISI